LIRGGGLRGGHYFETRNSIAIRNVVYIPGVRVTGAITEGGRAKLRISGRKAAHGQLTFHGDHVSGVLAGRRVNGRIHSLAKPARAAVAATAHIGR
jgi:hypothetical protein